MSQVSFSDITLSQAGEEAWPYLEGLKKGLLKQPAQVCIERARYMTRYLQDSAQNSDPVIIRQAKAVSHFLHHKEPLFPDRNLLAGTTTSKPFGAPVYPEWTGLTIWPELDTISTRASNPLLLSPPDADELNLEIFPYWLNRNVLEYTRAKHGNPDCMRLMERIVFFIGSKSGAISHTVPYYKAALDHGLNRLIQAAAVREAAMGPWEKLSGGDLQKAHFYRAVQIALAGIIAYARNLAHRAAILAKHESDPVNRTHLIEMARVCKKVPEHPATTFREALNALWIIQIGIHAENINMAMSPGRLDQVLWDHYHRDRDQGRITEKQALELIGCLWLKLNDNTNLVPETAAELFGGAGTAPAVTLGGVTPDGKDAVNDLTYLMLRATELLQTRDPSLNARYHYEINTKQYRDRVAGVIAGTKAVPAMHNDVSDIQALMNQGVSLEHARDYAIIGCVELASAGRSYDASSSIMLNLASVLELTLYNGKRPVTGDEQITPPSGDPAGFTSYAQFWEAFKKQAAHVISKAIELNEILGHAYQEILPSPLLSAFFQGPLDKGKDLIFGGALYNSSGATNIGFADTVDSLSAIGVGVFLEKRFDVNELLRALQDDFEGHGEVLAYLVNKAPKYGSGNPIARNNAQNLLRFIYDFYQAHENYRGGRYRPGYWTMTNHAGQGKLCGALPSGRKAHQVFASGITPVSQAAGDLGVCLKEVGGLDPLCIPGGQALNLKFPQINGEQDQRRLGDVAEAYFRHGGLHVQFNIMSYEDLIQARDNPDAYPDLLVRVSGYSAYFKDLSPVMKEEIITRTAYDLHTQKAIPFPGPGSQG